MTKYEWQLHDVGLVRFVLLADGKVVGMAIAVPWGWIAVDHASTDGHYGTAQAAKKAVEVLVGADGHDD